MILVLFVHVGWKKDVVNQCLEFGVGGLVEQMNVFVSMCVCFLNPFTAPVCKISRLKDAWTRLQTIYFPVL